MYSVPEYLVGHPLSVYAFCDRIELYDAKGKKVATHVRAFTRQQTFINPQHRSFTKTSLQAKNQRIYTVVKNLDPVVEQFLGLNQEAGENVMATATHLFKLLKTHAKTTIVSAVKSALQRRSPRLKCITSILEPSSKSVAEDVAPQNRHILDVDHGSSW